MFESFFPSPKKFFLSAVVWFFVCLALWFGLFDGMAAQFSLMREALPATEGGRPPFLNPDKVWLYQYIVLVTLYGSLGKATTYRRRRTASAGRHDAFCRYSRGTWFVLH